MSRTIIEFKNYLVHEIESRYKRANEYKNNLEGDYIFASAYWDADSFKETVFEISTLESLIGLTNKVIDQEISVTKLKEIVMNRIVDRAQFIKLSQNPEHHKRIVKLRVLAEIYNERLRRIQEDK